MISQPLTFYTDATEVDYLKPLCKDECVYELNAPNDSLLPFIIKRQSIPDPINYFRIQCFDGSGLVNIDPTKIVIAHSNIIDGIAYDYLVYDGQDIGITIDCGQHQAVINDSVNTWYSEIFTVGDWSAGNSPYVRVDYFNDCALEGVPYDAIPSFNFYFFLNQGVTWGLPQVSQEIQSETDNFGREIQTSVKFDTLWLLQTGSIPLYLVNAWVFCVLHETVTFTEENNGKVVTITNVELTHEPDDNGCTNEIDLRFKIEPDIVQGSCCDDIAEQCGECIEELTSIQIVDFELAMNQLLVEALPPTVGDIYAIENDALGCPSVDWCNHLNELATWNGVDWDYSSPAEGDIAWKSPNFYWFTSSVWTLIPNITTVTSIGINSWNVIGDAHPCYFVRMEFSYDGGTTWPTIAGYFTASEFSAGVDIASVAVPTHTRAVMFNYNCPSITSKSASLP